jgi:hypothetical protein
MLENSYENVILIVRASQRQRSNTQMGPHSKAKGSFRKDLPSKWILIFVKELPFLLLLLLLLLLFAVVVVT